jgi:glucose/arabinose dehydrogenase
MIGVALVAAAALTPAPPRLPPHFVASVYARGLTHPTALAFGPNGILYASEEAGTIVSVTPGAHVPRVFASGFRESTLGLTWLGGRLYVSDKGRVSVLTDPDGNRVANDRRTLVDGLPNGRHQQDNIVAGPDGRLYLGSGSTCNACPQRDRRSAAILSLLPSGKDLRVVASGLRNPYGLAFDAHGQLWATDNGRDELSLNAPDELNRIVPGHRYGFPGCYGVRRGTGCAGTDPPAAVFEPHSSADGLAFAPASFAPGMGGDAFVACWGTYFGTAHGRYVARVHFANGRTTVTRFATGFDHPLAVAFAPGGQMLVADWGTGIIWRIVFPRGAA